MTTKQPEPKQLNIHPYQMYPPIAISPAIMSYLIAILSSPRWEDSLISILRDVITRYLISPSRSTIGVLITAPLNLTPRLFRPGYKLMRRFAPLPTLKNKFGLKC